uniref:Uncharacterized protein n=1 Tax=Triticum urartu TaxID=4572 RepID=A0A8R7JVC6_TRIUA
PSFQFPPPTEIPVCAATKAYPPRQFSARLCPPTPTPPSAGDFPFSYVGILACRSPAGRRRTPRCHAAPLPTLIATPSCKMGSAMSRRCDPDASDLMKQISMVGEKERIH